MFAHCLVRSTSKFSETNPLLQLFELNGLIFLLCSIITLLKQRFGNPIDCIYDGIFQQEKSFVGTYCWKNYEPIVPQSTPITLPHAAVNKDLQVFTSNMFHKRQSNYHRWLPLILLFQTVLTYMPAWVWNAWRDKRLKETIFAIKEPNKQPNRRKLLIINLANDLYTEAIQRRYAKTFFFCEILNIISFFLNICFTSILFQHRFITYGVNEIGMRFKIDNYASSNSEMFPTFARCCVQLARKEEGIITKEAICMISFNSLCENIFLFLWFWFLLLSLASVIGIFYRVFMMLSRGKRKTLLMEAVDRSYEEKMSTICKKLGFYSWFTLYRVSRNVDPLTFQDIVSSLIVRIDSPSLGKIARAASRNSRRQNRERTYI